MRKSNWAQFLALVLLICTSCDRRERDSPILSHAQMVNILTQIYIAEQKVNRWGLPRDSSEHEFERFRHIIFERKNMSDSVFKKSFDYYMDHPKEMEMIYTGVVDSLSLMEQHFDSTVK